MTAHSNKIREKEQFEITVYILNFFVYVLSIFCTMVVLIGAYDFFINVEANKCEMTYMYEFPQYVKIPMPIEADRQFSMYGLYAYTEGKQIDNVRHLKFTGIPVLFLPGNAGSYKQVRSVASVALRKWLNSRTPYHFDFFTIDFHEEMSGIYGYVLERQSQYARRAVDRIMTFYEDFHQVILIGHSMGGLIAKSINVDEIKSQLIFTLATPHQRALLLTDPEFDLFYFHIERNWTNLLETEGKQVSLVSVAGGDRDWIIPDQFTKWKHNDIQTSAPSIAGVWASTDHLCIVWCKQLVMAIVRSLFDMVEYRKKSNYFAITSNVTLRTSILNYHFKKRTSGKSYHSAHLSETEFGKPPLVSWNEYLKHDYCQPPSNQLTYLMLPMRTFEDKLGNNDDYTILLTTTNTKPKNWIYGCTGQTIVNDVRICSSLVNLSNQTEFLPSLHRRRKIAHLEFNQLRKLGFSHLIVKLDPVNFPSCVNAEIYSRSERDGVLGDKLAISNGMFFNISFPMSYHLSRLFAWKLTARPHNTDKNSQCHNSVALFRNGNFQTHAFLKNESLLVRVSDWNASSAHILLYMGRDCDFNIRVQLLWVETAGQIFRTYWRFLPTHFASVILMTLYFQKSKLWLNFHHILLAKAYYLTLVPGFIAAFMIMLLPNDFRSVIMLSPSEFSYFLPIVCYLVSFSIALVVVTGAYYVMLGAGGAFHAFTMRFLSRCLGNVPDKVTDLALAVTLEKFPISIAVLILSLAITTCGAMGLAVGLAIYLLKIFKLYEGLLEDLIRGKVESIGEAMSPINFHIHTSMLWFIVTMYNLPSMIYWINNFSYSEVPQWDLSMYVCLMLTPALAILWQGFVPDFHPTMWNIQRHMCYVMGLVMILWGTHRFYLVCFLIVLVLITMSMCQLISRFADTEEAVTQNQPPVSQESAPRETPQTPDPDTSTDELENFTESSQSDDVNNARTSETSTKTESERNEK